MIVSIRKGYLRPWLQQGTYTGRKMLCTTMHVTLMTRGKNGEWA